MNRLGGNLPIVVESDDWETVAEEIDDIFIGDAGMCSILYQDSRSICLL